jgi:ribosomal protein S18 acetylase RimI-like enzyme
MSVVLRAFKPEDSSAVNGVAVAAFEQYAAHYSDWPALSRSLANTASLADHGELIVAEAEGQVIGTVAYIGPAKPKNAFFEQAWPIMRMLVVSPGARGRGVGRLLAQECIDRALKDDAPVFALHTTPLMEVALSMYTKMGFTFYREAPAILGVPYGVYLKALA